MTNRMFFLDMMNYEIQKKYHALCIFMFFCFTSVFAQEKCNQGVQNLPNDLYHPYILGPGTTTSGGISANPNEIIGPTGFGDSIRWVSINDILNYTILFENDPEFATANAQKVDVRFTFDDKAYIKGFGLGTFQICKNMYN